MDQNETMPTVSLSLGLNDVIGHQSTWDDEGGHTQGDPITLLDAIIDRAADRLITEMSHQDRMGIRSRVIATRDAMIVEALAPHITAAIETPYQRTNGYGVPNGPQVSIREMVTEAIQTEATKAFRVGNERYDSSKSPMQRLIEETTPRVIAGELAETVAKAKAELRSRIAASAAQTMADTILSAVTKG